MKNENNQLKITLTQSISVETEGTTMKMESKQILELSNQDEVIYLKPDSILYVEADGNYCDIHLTDGDVVESVGFQKGEVAQKVDSQLANEHSRKFMLVGRKHIINIEHVMRINAPRQTLVFDINLPGTCKKKSVRASKKALSELRSSLAEPMELSVPGRRGGLVRGGFANYREQSRTGERNYEIGDDEVMRLGR